MPLFVKGTTPKEGRYNPVPQIELNKQIHLVYAEMIENWNLARKASARYFQLVASTPELQESDPYWQANRKADMELQFAIGDNQLYDRWAQRDAAVLSALCAIRDMRVSQRPHVEVPIQRSA